jgi:hypothetical protein
MRKQIHEMGFEISKLRKTIVLAIIFALQVDDQFALTRLRPLLQ